MSSFMEISAHEEGCSKELERYLEFAYPKRPWMNTE